MKGLYITLIVILSLLFLSLGGFLIFSMINGNFSFGPVDIIASNIRKEEIIDVNDLNNLNIKAISSKIYVYEATDNNVRIVEYSNNVLNANELFTVSKHNDSLNIDLDKRKIVIFGFIPSKVFEIYIPKDYCENLKIETVSSSVAIEKDLCSKQTTIKTTSGSIKAKNMMGEVDLNSVSGSINVGNIDGNTIMKTTSGSIRFNNIKDAQLKSISGSIKGQQIVGIANIETTSGKIEVSDFQIKGDSNFKSISGSISLSLTDSNCEIKTKTTSGKVTLPNDSAIVGTSPFNSLNIKTTSGSIRIN